MSQFTSQFLQRLYFNLPPLVPNKVREELENEIELLEREPKNVSELEDIIIAYAKELWPYTQAFEELIKNYLEKMGETLLLRKASYGLKAAYEKYRHGSGTWKNIYSGQEALVFTVEERAELHELLVDIMCDVRAFVRQSALLSDRELYEKRVNHYRERYRTIVHEINRLKNLAEKEENISLAREIRQHVRDLELGIAALGPGIDFEAVCSAHDHFVGRKKEMVARGVLHLY